MYDALASGRWSHCISPPHQATAAHRAVLICVSAAPSAITWLLAEEAAETKISTALWADVAWWGELSFAVDRSEDFDRLLNAEQCFWSWFAVLCGCGITRKTAERYGSFTDTPARYVDCCGIQRCHICSCRAAGTSASVSGTLEMEHASTSFKIMVLTSMVRIIRIILQDSFARQDN